MNFIQIVTFLAMGIITLAQDPNCTCPEPPVLQDLLPGGAYVYTTFLHFYRDNVYFGGYTFGDLYQSVIWIHLFSSPAMLFFIYAYHMRNYGDHMRNWRIGTVGMSFRKAIVWFSGILCCAHDLIWFLWLPLSDVIYWTFTFHVLLHLLGWWYIYTLLMMSPATRVRKSRHLDPTRSCDTNIRTFKQSLPQESRDTAFAIIIAADSGNNRDAFVGSIDIDGYKDGTGANTVKATRLFAGGMNEAEVRCRLLAAADSYMSGFPPYDAAVAHHLVNVNPMAVTTTDVYRTPTTYHTSSSLSTNSQVLGG